MYYQSPQPPPGQLKEQLWQALRAPLPGWRAHIGMAPPQRFPDKEPRDLPPPPDARLGAVLLLLYPKQAVWHIPFIVRQKYPGVHSGQIAFPGGKVDDTDADYVNTALRETAEEIGVTVSPQQVVGSLSPLYIPPSNFMVYPQVAVIDYAPVFEPEPTEVAATLEIPLHEFERCRDVHVRLWKDQEYHIPCFRVGEHIIWGATAMILNEFLQVWRQIVSSGA